ncbi:hypothetical protein EV182_002423 [Spiromyces aspiralis]|uniref:Uncharacterized protein n=1 Tax=Spiromyces aspiralis TaxID=68401 RepID=A0ACC1HVY9_9FUNG|nr:hypothetical protein EV182_002423 [Spiromyces aspiralis]
MDGVIRAAERIYDRMARVCYSCASWKAHALNPKVADERAVDWIFVVDTLNFSFFSDLKDEDRQYAVTLDGVQYKGYWSLCACINRALREGIPITDPKYYAGITSSALAYIFRQDEGREPIPLLEDRVKVLREAGQVLLDRFGGSFTNCIKECQGSAMRLLDLVTSNIGSYQDEHEFCGRTVYIYKRAQILISDLWACFEGRGLGCFSDIDEITMFADYRIPQALSHFGILEYSPSLMERLHDDRVENASAGTGAYLPSGHQLEVEIRGNSIWSVELLRREILHRNPCSKLHINSILLDFYIWDYAKAHTGEMAGIPIHRTRSIFY